ncbi:MAG: prolipoprotein diacylglyceryl transferase [candidate division Zixibacteria bacterium]|nr:prolipoprotein diacylglyceryl transferase [candidate division Zixibacteria bacterium]
MYPYLTIGPARIPSFGLMLVIAFLGAMWVLRRELKRQSLDPILSESLAIAAMAGGLIGAKAYYVLETFPLSLDDPLDFLFSGAGFTFYGGLIGGAAGVIFVIRHRALPLWSVLDAVALTLPLGYAVGRIGCQLAGDGDYGTPTHLAWGMAYPDGLIPTLERVHPTPVYEASASLAVFGTLLTFRARLAGTGRLLGLYLLLAGPARFFVEFIRSNPKMVFGLTDAQLISAVMTCVGVALFCL